MKDKRKRIKYEIGQRYHGFTIISEAPNKRSANGRPYTCWTCKCDCGNTFVTTTKQIQKGVRKSCGCKSQGNRFKKLDSKHVIGNYKFRHYVASAERRGLKWNLSVAVYCGIIYSKCHYCDIEPMNQVTLKSHVVLVNGVDRKDNNIGYLEENCVPCCIVCNRAKGTMSYEDFMKWIRRLKNENSSN